MNQLNLEIHTTIELGFRDIQLKITFFKEYFQIKKWEIIYGYAIQFTSKLVLWLKINISRAYISKRDADAGNMLQFGNSEADWGWITD